MKFTDKQHDVMNSALDYYGDANQVSKTIEELAELIKALAHVQIKREHNVAEELADVAIMCEQMMKIFDMEEIMTITSQKINRLEKRIRQ